MGLWSIFLQTNMSEHKSEYLFKYSQLFTTNRTESKQRRQEDRKEKGANNVGRQDHEGRLLLRTYKKSAGKESMRFTSLTERKSKSRETRSKRRDATVALQLSS